MSVNPAIEPRKTVRREFLTAIMAVMKKVLSPISEAVIISADVRKDEKKLLLFVALDSIMLLLAFRQNNNKNTNLLLLLDEDI